MKISASILKIKNDANAKIKLLRQAGVDFIHLDIMDNLFVPNQTWLFDEVKALDFSHLPLDVHLMVKDVRTYVDYYATLRPTYITFHLEAVDNPLEIINYIGNKGIKVGISIKPNTSIELLKPYLNMVDLVLLMSVEPGFGGQSFIKDTASKITTLFNYRRDTKKTFLIEVDGGIDDETIALCVKADIVVVGSFITDSNDYLTQVNKLKNAN